MTERISGREKGIAEAKIMLSQMSSENYHALITIIKAVYRSENIAQKKDKEEDI